MTEPTLPLTADTAADDLPLALRRERDARAMRDAEARARGLGLSNALDPPPATVTRVEIPFARLVVFFLKAVLAAIPALILLGAILWLMGELLEWIYPQLIQAKITIYFPK